MLRSTFRRHRLHSPDGRIKRRQRIEFVESGDIVLLLLLSWLMAYARRGDTGPNNPAYNTSKEAKRYRASSACLYTVKY